MILTAYLYVTAHMTGLTSRPSVARYAAMRPLSSRAPGSHWAWTSGRSNPATVSAVMPNSASIRSGRHLLDHEALSCLLVLLFIDDSRLNTSRLHRVLRNLCYHTATRVWIINTLLSILHHLCEGTASASQEAAAVSSGRSKRKTVDISGAGSPSAEMDSLTASGHSEVPTWLNIYLCAALGSQANVFQLQRTCPAVKHKASSAGRLSSVSQTSHTATNISIHPQASPIICRHVLDTLISLAKSFPNSFLPQQSTGTDRLREGSAGEDTSDKSKSSKSSAAVTATDFWTLLVKLDGAVYGKRGKSVQRSGLAGQSGPNPMPSESNFSLTGSGYFELSPLGQLMAMVAHPVIRRSQLLTDRLLRLLGLVSVGLVDTFMDSAARTISTNDTTVAATEPASGVVDALSEVAAAGATDNAVPVLGMASTDMQTMPVASQTADSPAAEASPNKEAAVTAASSYTG
jgi:E3 ubiquitin-protein ligase HUWE1